MGRNEEIEIAFKDEKLGEMTRIARELNNENFILKTALQEVWDNDSLRARMPWQMFQRVRAALGRDR